MDVLLTPDQFATRAVGIPWVRWRADLDGADCFGLVTLYYRSVLGICIEVDRGAGGVHGFAEWDRWEESWQECEPSSGAPCFMAWRDGAPTHCGILLPGSMLLHSQKDDRHPPGGVRVTRLSIIGRVYGRLSFYRYAPC